MILEWSDINVSVCLKIFDMLLSESSVCLQNLARNTFTCVCCQQHFSRLNVWPKIFNGHKVCADSFSKCICYCCRMPCHHCNIPDILWPSVRIGSACGFPTNLYHKNFIHIQSWNPWIFSFCAISRIEIYCPLFVWIVTRLRAFVLDWYV